MRKITTIEFFLCLGILAMTVSSWGANPEAGFAFGIGMALPGIWEAQKYIFRRLRRSPTSYGG